MMVLGAFRLICMNAKDQALSMGDNRKMCKEIMLKLAQT
jgi:hypothetical protein